MSARIDVQTEDLRLFVACVDEGTVSAAARTLGLTQAVATRRLQRLEAALGVAVLHRTTRALRPTVDGARVLGAARTMLAELAALARGSDEARHAPRGDVHVTAPILLGQAMGGALARELRRQHPGLRLHLSLDNARVDLVRSGMDVALRVGVLPDTGLRATRLTTARVGAYAARSSSKERRRTRAHPSSLLGLSWLGLPGASALRATGPGGQRWSGSVELGFVCDDRVVLREAAVLGLGAVLLPTFFGDAEPALERLVPDWHFGQVPIHALWLHESKDDSRVRAVLDAVTAWGKTQVW